MVQWRNQPIQYDNTDLKAQTLMLNSIFIFTFPHETKNKIF